MKLFNRLSAIAAILLGSGLSVSAAIPSGYYDKCEGKTGQALLEALYTTITSHTTVSYKGLWDLYKTSDIDENGKIWDMYSTKRWNPGNEQCGNYTNIGDCYNREHSFPKSWFDDASPMVSDAFHIYPTDGNAEATATVTDTPAPASFIEDWEEVENPTTAVKAYSSTTFQGTACSWKVTQGGFGTTSQDKAFNKTTALRMKNSGSSIAMNENKAGGLGTVTFDVAKWPNANDASVALTLYYSTDNGSTWIEGADYTISETTSKTYTATLNVPGEARIKFESSSSSGRWLIDNIAITNYSELGAIEELYYHSWDAFCRDSHLVVEVKEEPKHVTVYSIDGIAHISDTLEPGEHSFELAKGLYIVVVDDFSRRVVVK